MKQQAIIQCTGGPSTPAPGSPVADFTSDVASGAAPLTVTFTDTTTNTPTSWHWQKSRYGGAWVDFAGTPTVQNPAEDFAEGIWAVRLTAANASGTSITSKPAFITAGAPSLVSATVGASGLTLTLVFNETVAGHTGFTLNSDGGAVTATYSSGDGTTTAVFNLNRTISDAETLDLDYTPGNVHSAATGAPLAAISDGAVTNNSTQT